VLLFDLFITEVGLQPEAKPLGCVWGGRSEDGGERTGRVDPPLSAALSLPSIISLLRGTFFKQKEGNAKKNRNVFGLRASQWAVFGTGCVPSNVYTRTSSSDTELNVGDTIKADSHTACRAHAFPMPFPCHAVH
jgi:hypothetical protein